MATLTAEERKVLSEYMRRLGRKGGKATKRKHGRQHFRNMRQVQLAEKPKKA